MNVETVIAAVRSYAPSVTAAGGLKPAAVLVPIRSMGDGSAEVVLTRRSEHLASHAGQVSFPGGRIDPADRSSEDAALREAHEELGILPSAVEVIGVLDHWPTFTGFHVTPVVGVVDPSLELVPNPSEVARAFSIPLAELLRFERWEQRDHSHRESVVKIWHFAWDGEDVWGLTGHMLRRFVEILHSFRDAPST